MATAFGFDLSLALFVLAMRTPSKKPSSRMVALQLGQAEPTGNLPMLSHFSFGQELSFVRLFASKDYPGLI
jgi:hypothetical protein